jgi:phage terminase large subunit-like protein
MDVPGALWNLDGIDAARRERAPDLTRVVVAIAYYRHSADRIVAETNNGGDMVENTIRMIEANVPYSSVHASRGRLIRAEPIAALYALIAAFA